MEPVVHDEDVVEAEDHVTRRRRILVDRQIDVPADHQIGEFLPGRLGRVDRPCNGAAAQDRDPIGDLQDLAQLVGDEDDRRSNLGQATNDPEQLPGLGGREDGGWLIEHQDIALAIERLEDLDPLADADRKILDGRIGIHVESVHRGQLHDPLAGHLAVEGTEWSGHALRAERHRFDDIEDRHELEVLVDHADPGADRLAGITERAQLAVDQDLAGVRAIEPGQDVHQGGLARAVLAQEAQDLTPIDRNGDPVVGEDAREPLRDVLEFKPHGPSVLG